MVTLTAISPPEDVRHKQTETVAVVGETDFGSGTLYIAASVVVWISNDGRGFSLSYPTISMHAISRDTRGFPRPCIYMVIDIPEEKTSGRETNVHERCFAEKMAACSLKTESAASKTETPRAADASEEVERNGGGSGDDDDDEQSQAVEVRFVPSDISSLETIYQALSECQALHPDENESFSEDEEDEDGNEPQFGGASDEFRFDESGQLVLSRMRGVRTEDDELMEHEEPPSRRHQDDEEMETGQFEDAPE